MFELKHSFWPDATHVLNRVLIANVIGPFNGVIHVPAPVVVGTSLAMAQVIPPCANTV